jgi:HEPN domain-containing protein
MVRYWLRSARDDLGAGVTLFRGGHFRWAVFCCHLAIEKGLKAILQYQHGVLPPRLHDLRALLTRTSLTPPVRLRRFVDQMAGLSVPTRYPGPLFTSRLGLRKAWAQRAGPNRRDSRMVPTTVPLKSLAQRLVRCLEARGIVVEALYLFGSQARAEATPDSDIDVLLVSPTFAGKSFWARCSQVGAALSGVADPVQIYPVTPAEWRTPEPGGFIESLSPDLRQLYRRKSHRAGKTVQRPQ